jgi:hypothetical protein
VLEVKFNVFIIMISHINNKLIKTLDIKYKITGRSKDQNGTVAYVTAKCPRLHADICVYFYKI